MDKNAIKKYAIWARRELIGRVSQRAMLYGITAKGADEANAESVNGYLLSRQERRHRQALRRDIEKKGYEQVMEEAAYTWFSRFAALRFMEVNGYLPSQIRVFTNDAGEFKPQILAEATHLELDGLDRNRVYGLESANKTEELFKYLLIMQCNALSDILPGMFQRMDDEAELLLPDCLLCEGSVIEQMVAIIPEEDWVGQVQIVGWLYQYYNSEKKDEVFDALKKNVRVTKENIPAATQLFTPDWVVRYMAENSLGRLWVEGHPDDELKSKWKYYLEEAEQGPDVQAQLAEIRREYAVLTPEQIRCIDPCCGSGHILACLFDVLVQIYESYGYTAREAAQNIVRYNLHGLDIDKRAVQLACFAVMMKARQYDRQIFSRGLQPMVYCTAGDEEGENFGALVMVDDPGERPEDPQTLFELADYEKRLNVWSYRYLLAQKYHVVVTNPPYMSASNMNDKLTDYVGLFYPDSKWDLYAAFMEKCSALLRSKGLQGIITMHSWMTLGTYEGLRLKYMNDNLINMVHLGKRAFEEISGDIVQTTAWIQRSARIKGYNSVFIKLTEYLSQDEKERGFFNAKNRFIANRDWFSDIPGTPYAYWISPSVLKLYEGHSYLSDEITFRRGISTGENEIFLRLWYEVAAGKTNMFSDGCAKWFAYNKGGPFRKWYGNRDYVVLWENDGALLRAFQGSAVRNIPHQLKPCISYSSIATGKPSFRVFDSFLNDQAGNFLTWNRPGGCSQKTLLALLNSVVSEYLIPVKNTTQNITADALNCIPIAPLKGMKPGLLDALVQECLEITKYDWDCFETSWDFRRHPLVRGASTVAEAYAAWERECAGRFNRLKANEEELNRVFIELYGLQDELTPGVEDKYVTVRRAELGRDIRSLISYAVGCMFGRYSLDLEGLACAGGEWDSSQYVTFPADHDNIIPICDGEYFPDDIIGRFVNFIEVVYGKDTLEENLRFIAEALGGKGAPREILRSYFRNGFYADHLKIYQKRPIYWLFDSGKKSGFKALVYMHRYQSNTIAKMRTDYIHKQQSYYRTAIANLEQRVNGASTSERVKLSKQLAKLQARAEEIRIYEEKIHHLADQYITIDLDDGVKKNYAMFGDVLARIK